MRGPVPDGRVERIEVGGVSRAYLLYHPSLERLLFDRNLLGAGFAAACHGASKAMCLHFQESLLESNERCQLAELMLLSKGMCYGIGDAFTAATGAGLPTNLLATSRDAVGGESATIGVSYSNFDAGGSHLVIGDTVATGSTICTALRAYEQRQRIEKIHLFSIAGSVKGVQAIGAYCSENDIELTAVFGLAAFGLAANGFDLPFQHPDTITDPVFVQRANEVFHGKPISAVGWDFGSQMQAPRKYRQLCWLEREYWDLVEADVFREVEEPLGPASLVEKERIATRVPPGH